jgi:hypothetical protein
LGSRNHKVWVRIEHEQRVRATATRDRTAILATVSDGISMERSDARHDASESALGQP